jgi:hypothetical protein
MSRILGMMMTKMLGVTVFWTLLLSAPFGGFCCNAILAELTR